MNLNQAGQDYSYLYDGKGNVMAVLDNTQAVVASYRYDEFGNLMKKTGTFDQPFMFSTKRYDEQTRLLYYGYRFYNPAIGRWMTRDPMGEAGGINLYGFNKNNPINYIDPIGLWFGIDDLVTGPVDEIIVLGLIYGLTQPRVQDMLAENTKHIKDVIDGQLDTAREHATKCSVNPPEDPNQKKWKKEIKAALDKAQRLAEKRLKGKTRDSILKIINDIRKSVF